MFRILNYNMRIRFRALKRKLDPESSNVNIFCPYILCFRTVLKCGSGTRNNYYLPRFGFWIHNTLLPFLIIYRLNTRDEDPVLAKKTDLGLSTSNEDGFLLVFKANILDNFNSLLFVFIFSVSDVP